MALQHIRSSTLDKRPQPASLSDGQLAINTNLNAPGVFFKDSNGALVKVGPTFVGTTAPNSTPGSGGATGNTLGEQWLDTSGGTYVLKIWDGTAWRSEAGEFVNVTGDTMTGALVMDNQQQVRFRETTANGTNYIALQAPASVASDKTITLPDVTGTVVTTGDTGSVTSTMIADGTIVNGDVNASAAIAGTKISPDFGSQNVTTTGTVTGASLNPTSSTVPTNGVYLPAANSVGISTGGSGRLFIDSSGRVGVGTGSPTQKLSVADAAGLMDITSTTGTNFNGLELKNTSGSLYVGTDSSTGSFYGAGNYGRAIYSTGAYPLAFFTNATRAMTIDSSQRVGIGVTDPGSYFSDARNLVVGNTAGDAGVSIVSNTSNKGTIAFADGTTGDQAYRGYIQYSHNGDALAFATSGTEAFRVDSSRRLLVGTSSAFTQGGDAQYGRFHMVGNTFSSAGSAILALGRGEVASAITADEALGIITFSDNAGNTFAGIYSYADANAGAGDYPGRLVFATTADGASSPTERMRIQSGGTVLISKTSSNIAVAGAELAANGMLFTVDNAQVAYFNRSTSDGTIIEFRQDNNIEGTISVSGTTVSYNGAHLSRWSQLPSGAERTEILRGTVLSNLDEMCEWGDEDNEQLNRMKVSDVEGDKNVSGVFQAWDDDDDTYTNDFYCAMTGDFIIRIAQGVTVERGDLLMSAGDGTAKPQDDDIIRSKTIAKVTSTNVSCTYDDGSYCVPCVLMAC